MDTGIAMTQTTVRRALGAALLLALGGGAQAAERVSAVWSGQSVRIATVEAPQALGQSKTAHHSERSIGLRMLPGQGDVLVAGGAVHADADSDGQLDAGETIDYHYTVLSLGDAALSGLSLGDSFGAVTCPQTTLAAGAHMVCTRSHAVTPAEATAGAVANTVTVTGTDAGSLPVSASDVLFTQTLGGNAGVRVFKVPSLETDADTSGVPSVGDLLRYTFVVKNSGGEALSSVLVSEPDASRIDTAIVCSATTLGGAAFAGNGSGALASNDAVLCQADYTIRTADAALGQVLNLSEVTATAPVYGAVVGTGASTVVAQEQGVRSLLLDKRIVSGGTFAAVGDVIAYAYDVSNTGNLPLAGPVTVADDRTTVACPALATVGNGDSALDPGETVTCTATHVVTVADVMAGSVVNVATATVEGIDSNTDTATATGPAIPLSIGVSKVTASVTGRNPVTVEFRMRVRNYGALPLSGVQVDEDLRAAFPLPVAFAVQSVAVTGTAAANAGFDGEGDTGLLDPSQSTLAVGGEIGITLVLELQPAGERGPFYNTVLASGAGPDDTVVSDVSVSNDSPDPDSNGRPDEEEPAVVQIPRGIEPVPTPAVIPVAGTPGLLLLALVLLLGGAIAIPRSRG